MKLSVQDILDELFGNDELEIEYSEALNTAFTTIQDMEVAIRWTDEDGIDTLGLIWIDGNFYDIDKGATLIDEEGTF